MSTCCNSSLTRPLLETAMKDWTKQNEGPIGYEYISLLLNDGEVLSALERVATSMQIKQLNFDTNNACLIWTAYMNMQEYGSPGFLTSSSSLQSNGESSLI